MSIALQVLWAGLMTKHGISLQKGFDKSTLAYMSEGYTAGGMEEVPDPHIILLCMSLNGTGGEKGSVHCFKGSVQLHAVDKTGAICRFC